MSGEKTFVTLGDAFQFLDKELKEIQNLQDQYHHHIKEMIRQLAEHLKEFEN
jgi:prefoldin subunit 5